MSNKLEIYYCPGCGNALKSYEAICPMCKSEIRKQEVSKAIKEFVDGINEIKNRKMPEKEDSLLKKVIGRDFRDENEKDEFEEKKEEELINFIKNYTIPPSREDIISFMILISNNISINSFESLGKLDKVWIDKFKQTYDIAKISIKDEKEFQIIRDIYDKKMNDIKNNSNKFLKMLGKGIVVFLLLCISMAQPLLSLLALVLVSVFLFLKTKSPLPNNKFFKIIYIVIAVLSIISIITRCTHKIEQSKKAKITFSDFVLEKEIPSIAGNIKGEIYNNTDQELHFRVYKIKSKDYYKYLNKCKKMGYVLDAEKDDSSYHAYSKKGFELSLDYYQYSEEMEIALTKNEVFSKIEWPDSELVKMIPKPKSDIGKILINEKENFTVKISGMTKKDFEEYIASCKELGFAKEVEEEDKSYYATNDKRYRIEIKYIGNDVIEIALKEPLYNVKLVVDCEENLVLSKYNISVYLDYDHLGDIDHGSNDTYDLKLTKGKHTVEIENAEDSEIEGTININVLNDTTIELEVTCTSEKVKIKNKSKKEKTIKKDEKIESSEENTNETKKESIFYSTNDSSTVKNGNQGIYSYKGNGPYYNYVIIDLNDGYVYSCPENDSFCWKSKIESGDLNSVLTVVMHDAGNEYRETYHFKYKNTPDILSYVDNDNFTCDYKTVSINDALKIKDSREIFDL